MGRVEAICVVASASEAMRAVSEIEAIAGVGLDGDRYALGNGFYSDRATDPGAREVTLFEAEVLEALRSEHGIDLRPTEHRRNLTVRGIQLDALIGQRFHIGDVVLEGVKDCPPCDHLQQLVGKAVLQPLLERGGLRARIVQSGMIRVGDALTVVTTAGASTA
jgi:MOSC domain-containing protein YiiM